MEGNVYLIFDVANDAYKIGVTRASCEKRLKQLQTGNTNELDIVYHRNTKYPYKLESMLHRHFNAQNVLNEWFKLSNDDVRNFPKTCEHYEHIIDSLKENPFFAKSLR